MASQDRRDLPDLLDYLSSIDRLPFSRKRLFEMVAGATALGAIAPGAARGAARHYTRMAAPSATAADTLVVAVPATPSTLDPDTNVDIQTTDAIGMLYDSLMQFPEVKAPQNPNVRRDDRP